MKYAVRLTATARANIQAQFKDFFGFEADLYEEEDKFCEQMNNGESLSVEVSLALDTEDRNKLLAWYDSQSRPYPQQSWGSKYITFLELSGPEDFEFEEEIED